jgi:hypothetical protein
MHSVRIYDMDSALTCNTECVDHTLPTTTEPPRVENPASNKPLPTLPQVEHTLKATEPPPAPHFNKKTHSTSNRPPPPPKRIRTALCQQ